MERSTGDCLTLEELYAGLTLEEGDDWALIRDLKDVPGSSSAEDATDESRDDQNCRPPLDRDRRGARLWKEWLVECWRWFWLGLRRG